MSQAGLINLAGGTVTETLTGNDGVAVPPSGNNINVIGTGAASSGLSSAGNIYITGNAGTSTLTIQETQAQYLTNYTPKNFAASPYSVTATDYYIAVDSSGGNVTIKLPNAPTTYRMFLIKDKSGNSLANNISITTVGGVVTIDGVTTYILNENYESANLMFNGTSYEVF